MRVDSGPADGPPVATRRAAASCPRAAAPPPSGRGGAPLRRRLFLLTQRGVGGAQRGGATRRRLGRPGDVRRVARVVARHARAVCGTSDGAMARRSPSTPRGRWRRRATGRAGPLD
ncbi:hypothetical protein BU14_0615s0012 [Porphyra umbilicalis]|uniref:Uncharacterized protein n=1 Tax=Porphyra umbilicalis TaxID=2786 RepID=A0A1X6NRK1_PORUM|nr:hypothetical protein BU14_0615s0012 [Porphyra umbilicalis]|eukprot:OSX71023.1 hypothetical protein BU14_0615s0012 [Porphyra umbilicalis]